MQFRVMACIVFLNTQKIVFSLSPKTVSRGYRRMRDTWRIASQKAIFGFSKLPAFRIAVPSILQFILNASLTILATVLCILMAKEIFHFVEFIVTSETTNFHHFLEQILVFFLYFEFISMIVKYFRENYHFPMRYFLYIGITAMLRLIIVDHENPFNTLLHAFVILILILSYYIINKTSFRKSLNKRSYRITSNPKKHSTHTPS